MKFVKLLKNLTIKNQTTAGSKAANLGEISNNGIRIPQGFVLLDSCYDLAISEIGKSKEISEILANLDKSDTTEIEFASSKIRNLFHTCKIPTQIENEVRQCLTPIISEKGVFLAIRSSSTGEDGRTYSWAGQLESFLNVTPENIWNAVRLCWSSLFTVRSILYQRQNNIRWTDLSVPVVVQVMINSEVSGVAFSADPMTGNQDNVIVEAVLGIGEPLVAGVITPDTFLVDKKNGQVTENRVTTQNKGLYRSTSRIGDSSNSISGNEWLGISEPNASNPKLSSQKIKEISELVQFCEIHFGYPCDVEWTYNIQGLHILQVRPITGLSKVRSQPPTFSFEHPKIDFNEKSWVCLERPGSPIYKDPHFRAWAFQDDPEFSKYYYPTKLNYEDWHLLFRQGQFYGKYNVKLFGYGLLDYFMSRENFDAYLNKKHQLKGKIQTIWRLCNRDYIRSLPHNKQIDLIDRCLSLMTEGYIIDVMSPMVGEMASEYTNWWLDLKEVHNSQRSEVFQDLFFCEEISETVMRQIRIKKVLDAAASEVEREAAILELLRDYAHVRSDFGGYVPYTRDNLLSEYETSKNIRLETKQGAQRKEGHLTNLAATADERWIFYLFGYCQYSRDERKEYIQKLITIADWALECLAETYSIPLLHLRSTLVGELRESNLTNTSYRTLLANRYRDGLGMSFQNGNRGEYVLDNGGGMIFDNVATGVDDAPHSHPKKQLVGQGIYIGKVVGRVKVVKDAKEVLTEDGFVLVTGMTSPDYLSIMQRSVAILTDEGGITCHAAILSRELRIPCIVGLKMATEFFKDGDYVEVNSISGIATLL